MLLRRLAPQSCVILSAVPFALLSPPALAQDTALVSRSPAGVEGDLTSTSPALSADGRLVAFLSDATTLVPGDTNGQRDVFVFDRLTAELRRVSVDSAGNEAHGSSTGARLSADGRFVVFVSSAPDLVPADANGNTDVFVHELATGFTARVSLGLSGAEANGDSFRAAISGDGRFVAFESSATNLVHGDTNGWFDVFVFDRLAGTTVRASVGSLGAEANGACTSAAISADGRLVAFQSAADDLVLGDLNFAADVFVRDLATGVTELVSTDEVDTQGNGDSLAPAISADGRFVAYTSVATNLVPNDANGWADVFVRDRLLGLVERASLGPGGLEADGASSAPRLSADGRFVAFTSAASVLVAGDTNGASDVFFHDRASSTTERMSVSSSGTEATGHSDGPSLSADGRHVAFRSTASDLVAGDTNGLSDVFVHDRARTIVSFCAGDGLDTSHTTSCPCGNVGAPGHGCANSVTATGAQLVVTGDPRRDDVRLVATSLPATASCVFLQGDARADARFGDGVRCVGGVLLRLRASSAAGGACALPAVNDPVALSTRGGVAPFSSAVRGYQAWYRNGAAAFCPPETSNVTNAVEITW